MPDISDKLLALTEVCTLCGSCLTACPVYNIARTEPQSPRGKINLVKSLIGDRISDSSEINELMKCCLLCGNCNSSCSRGVDVRKIILGYRAFSDRTRDNGVYNDLVNSSNGESNVELSKMADNDNNYDILLFPGQIILHKYPELLKKTVNFLRSKGMSVLIPEGTDYRGNQFNKAGSIDVSRQIINKNTEIFNMYKYNEVLCMNGRDAQLIKEEYDLNGHKIYELSEYFFEYFGDRISGKFFKDNGRTEIHFSLFNKNFINDIDRKHRLFEKYKF